MTIHKKHKARYYQEEADQASYNELLLENKCLIKMFCGTGKSLLMAENKTIVNKDLVVYVFPSLSLIEQFYKDYLDKIKNVKILKICSERESTTDVNDIKTFLLNQSKKIICITYHSFKTLLDNLGDVKINVCIFDEAHHAVGETYQNLIFENNVCEKQMFFTATPVNKNNIEMLNDKGGGMCGRLVYDYSYLRGVNEGYLNSFEIRIDLSCENTNTTIFESIARAVLDSGNNRVLTFHSDVNTERETSVNQFVQQEDFCRVFREIQIKEFPHLATRFKQVKMIGLSSNLSIKERTDFLNLFDKTPDNEVIVICSCETIGEGIDTKNANMCVFVDPKSSFVKIIQNIGRIVRKEFGKSKPNSTILIPCWVDKNKYIGCDEDREKCDEVIRQDMGNGGNFNRILNVMSALKQEDQDLYDICLHYPDSYSPQEIEANLERQGYRVIESIGDGNLFENLEYMLDSELSFEDYEEEDSEEEMLNQIAKDNDVCIEIHSNSLDNPVKTHYNDCKNRIRLLKMTINEEEDEVTYCPIVKTKNGNKEIKEIKKNKDLLEPLKKENRFNIKVNQNPDVQVLWKIIEGDFTKEISSCILDCEIVDREDLWELKLNQLKDYILINNKRPSCTDKNKEIKRLGKWIQPQQENYKTKTQIMKNQEIRIKWEQFINEYQHLFLSNEEEWIINLNKVREYINLKGKRPSDTDKNKEIKLLGYWICNQQKNYKTEKYIMKNQEIRIKWEEFTNEFQQYFLSNEEEWIINLNKVREYINLKGKRPTYTDKNKEIKSLGCWIQTQQENYKTKTKSMKNKEIRIKWEEFTNEYQQYFYKLDKSETETVIESEKTNTETKRIKIKIKSMKLPKKSESKKETTEEDVKEKQKRIKSEISVLHQLYKTMNSSNLYKKFNENDKQLWREYHEISEENEKSFPEDEIPRNRIIQELLKIKTKRTKLIVDMGCGKAQIAKYFNNDQRFKFINYDHVSCDNNIQSCDISSMPLEDNSVEICLLSLAMWGSNCHDYLMEAYRVLESGGKLYIIEPTRRWTPQDGEKNIMEGKEGDKLKDLLEEKGFKIMESPQIDKFCLFVCECV